MPDKVFTENDEVITSKLSHKSRSSSPGGKSSNNVSRSKTGSNHGNTKSHESIGKNGIDEKQRIRNDIPSSRGIQRTPSEEDTQYDHYASIPSTPQIPQPDYETSPRRGQPSRGGSNHGNKYGGDPEVHRRISKSTEERKRLASDRQHRHHRNTQSLDREGNYHSGLSERSGHSDRTERSGLSERTDRGGHPERSDRSGTGGGVGSGGGSGSGGSNYHRTTSQDRNNYHMDHERNTSYHTGHVYEEYPSGNEGRLLDDDRRDEDGVIDARDVDINALNESIIWQRVRRVTRDYILI